ncbi:MAG: PglZ domain-containing protein [Deltaproteobacteria bacterium]|nr:PglZ domain-containing protein [Deltaproteobacteria bacterium]
MELQTIDRKGNMIIQWLTEEFQNYFSNSPHHTLILFFDPAGEYSRLVPKLANTFDLISYEGSQLRIKYQIEMSDDENKRWLVYLPMRKQEAKYLLEYTFVAKVFDDTLYQFLKKHNVSFPTDRAEQKKIREMLPHLAVASVGKGESFWEKLSAQNVYEKLIGDRDFTLMRLLDSPQRVFRELDEQGIAEIFKQMVAETFGFETDTEDEEKWADEFTALIAVTELYCCTEKQDDFPLKNPLPDETYFDRCVAFVRKWQDSSSAKAAYKMRIKSLEEQYNLTPWVSQLPLEVATQAFLQVEVGLQDALFQKLKKIETLKEAEDFLINGRESFERRAKGFWAQEGEIPFWDILYRAADTVWSVKTGRGEQENVSRQGRSGFSQPDEILKCYADSWWQADRAYRQFKQGIYSAMDEKADYGALSLWVDKIYYAHLSQLNGRFCDGLDTMEKWGFSALPFAGDFWENHIKSNGKRRAIFFVDALRYELGHQLAERLQSHFTVQLSAYYANIPTVTSLGMSELLPKGDKEKEHGFAKQRRELAVSISGKKWDIRHPAVDGNLLEKSVRKELIEKQCGDVHFLELEELLSQTPKKLNSKNGMYVVFSTEIDATGESVGLLAIGLFSNLVDDVTTAALKIAQLVDEIHIVSDHGFLMLFDVAETDKVEVKEDALLIVDERYGVGTDIERKNRIKFPLQGSSLEVIFPRGITCFKTPGSYEYVHGGLSLQEIVIPHIKLETSSPKVKMEIHLEASENLTNAIFKVKVVPHSEELFAEARDVKVYVEKDDTLVSNEAAALVEGVWEASLKLDATKLSYGDVVSVKVIDAQTSQMLASQAVKVLVDFSDDF